MMFSEEFATKESAKCEQKRKPKKNEMPDVPGGAVGRTGAAEVLVSLPGGLATPQEEGVGTSGSAESELVESEDLAAILENALAGTLGEPQSAHADLGELEKAGIIGNGADDDDNLALLALDEASELNEGERGLVGPAHAQALEDDAVEVRTGPASQEPVELDKEGTYIAY